MMKQKPLFYSLIALLTLLAGCQPNPSSIPGSHRAASVNTPPPPPPSASAQPGESSVPYDPDHPLGQWQSDGYFRDTQVIIPDVEKYPILIAEPARLNWEKMKAFAFSDVPEGTEFLEHGSEMNLSPDDMTHFISSLNYETEYGKVITGINKQLWENRYNYYKYFAERRHRYNCATDEWDDCLTNVLEPARSISGIRYSPEDAARMVEETLRDWGVDTSMFVREPIMMHDSIPYHYLPGEGDGEMLTDTKVWDKEPNYLLTYRHAPYGITVFDDVYCDAQRDFVGTIFRNGEYIQAAVNNLGIRMLKISYRFVIDIEQEHAPAMPLEEIITVNSSAIKTQVKDPITRIELLYAPVAAADLPYPRIRLVPTWGFFTSHYTSAPFTLIDATTGLVLTVY